MIQPKRMPISSLVEDMEIYPRHKVDSSHVASIALAIEAGVDLPPIVADRKSKRIVDGWHRYRGHKKVYGVAGEIKVLLKSYKDEAELVSDAVQLNSGHGRRLGAVDETRSAAMLQALGVEVPRIAVVLKTTVERVEKRLVRLSIVKKSSPQAIPKTAKLALKQSTKHFAGKKMTEKQQEAHKSMPGTSFRLLAQQLATAIEADLIDLDEKALRSELIRLRDLLLNLCLPE